MEIISILALLSAIAATVLAFIFIVPEKKRAKLGGIAKLLHDILNFKFLIVEKIMQAFYIFSTAFVMMTGFFMLFYVEEVGGYYYSSTVWYGGYGLLVMILGPILVRLAYEFVMMFILLIKNVIQINNKLKAADGEKKEEDIFASSPMEVIEKYEPEVCPGCGAKVDGSPFCGTCGTKLK